MGYLLVSNWGRCNLSSDAGLFSGMGVGWAPSHAPWPQIAQPSSILTGACENTQNINGPRCTMSASLASKPPSSDTTKPFWPRRSRRMPGWGTAWTEWERRQGAVFWQASTTARAPHRSPRAMQCMAFGTTWLQAEQRRRTQTSKRLTERSAYRRREYGQKCRRSYTHHAVAGGTEIDTHLLDRLTTRSALTR